MDAINHETVGLQHQAWKDGAEEREKKKLARRIAEEKRQQEVCKENMRLHLEGVLLILKHVAASDSTDDVYFTSRARCDDGDVYAIKLKLEALGFTVIHPICHPEPVGEMYYDLLCRVEAMFTRVSCRYNAPFNITVKNTWATSPDSVKTE